MAKLPRGYAPSGPQGGDNSDPRTWTGGGNVLPQEPRPDPKSAKGAVFGRRDPAKTAELQQRAAEQPLPKKVYDEASRRMRRPTGRTRDGKFTFERGE